MGKIVRFEDLIIWQKTRELPRNIVDVSRQGAFAKDHGLSGQIQRAAVSIMSNIIEGFEPGGRGEVHQFLSTEKSSCAEVFSPIYVAVDVGYLDKAMIDRFMQQAEEVACIVGGLRTSVQRQKEDGCR